MTAYEPKSADEIANEISHEVWHEVWENFDEQFKEEGWITVAFVCPRCRSLKTKERFLWWNESYAEHGDCPVCPDDFHPICSDCMREVKAIIADRVARKGQE